MSRQETLKREYEKIVNAMLGLHEDSEVLFESASDKIIVGIMLCKRLDRIADALEFVNSNLQKGALNENYDSRPHNDC